MTGRQLTLYNTAKEALPRWLFQREQRAVSAMAAMFAVLWDQIDEWLDATYITRATGFWLDQHAVDRGTRRQYNEGDATLQERLRFPLDAVTPAALLPKVVAILATAGILTAPTFVELRRDRAFFGDDATGHDNSYFSTGYRMGSSAAGLIVILPYPTPAEIADSVREMLRTNVAGGVSVVVERRLHP